MKIICALFVVVACSLPVRAQSVLWTHIFGGSGTDIGQAVAETADGGFVMAGTTTSFGGHPDGGKIYLVRTNKDGDTIWTKVAGTGYYYEVEGVFVHPVTNIIVVAGYVNPTARLGNTQLSFLAEFTPNGDSVFYKTWTGHPQGVRQTSDGHIIYAGSNLALADLSGNLIFNKQYGGAGVFYYNITETEDGFLAVGESSQNESLGIQAYLLKINSNGDSLWSASIGGMRDDYAYAAQQTIDGGYLIAGKSNSYSSDSSMAVYLAKADPKGSEVWHRTFAFAPAVSAGDQFAHALENTADANYIMVGTTAAGEGFVLKVTPAGDSLAGTVISEAPLAAVAAITGGDHIIAGHTAPGVAPPDAILLKFSEHAAGVASYISSVDRLSIRPNPASSDAILTYTVKKASPVHIEIWDAIGTRVAVLEAGNQAVGEHQIALPISSLQSGVFECVIRSGEGSVVVPVVVRR